MSDRRIINHRFFRFVCQQTTTAAGSCLNHSNQKRYLAPSYNRGAWRKSGIHFCKSKGNILADKLPIRSLLPLLQIAAWNNLKGTNIRVFSAGFPLKISPSSCCFAIDHGGHPSQATIQFLVARKPTLQRPSEVS